MWLTGKTFRIKQRWNSEGWIPVLRSKIDFARRALVEFLCATEKKAGIEMEMLCSLALLLFKCHPGPTTVTPQSLNSPCELVILFPNIWIHGNKKVRVESVLVVTAFVSSHGDICKFFYGYVWKTT